MGACLRLIVEARPKKSSLRGEDLRFVYAEQRKYFIR